MISTIRNDKEKVLYVKQLKELNEILIKQKTLPKEARITGKMLKKMTDLYEYLEEEILKYDQIQKC